MPTIYDLHLPTEKKLQIVMASPNAVAIFNDATHLPYELAFGLTEKCTVAPMDEKSGVYCVTKSDDPAVTGFYTLIQGKCAFHTTARKAESICWCCQRTRSTSKTTI